MFKIKVNRNIISVQETESLTSGSVSVYHCQFSFDHSWEGFFRSAVFRVGSMVRTVPLDEGDTCDIPWELLVREHIGLPVEVSVYGTKDETEILPTIWDKLGRIRGGSEPGEDAKEFSPGVYDRIVSLVKVYSDKTKGDKGDKGDPGEGDMVATVYDPDGAVASEGGISSYVGGQIGTHNNDTAAHADIRAELATKTNPNLLHNWYLENPVDQRCGYVFDTNTYPAINTVSSSWETLKIGFVRVESLLAAHDGSGHHAVFTHNGVIYHGQVNMHVRGYIGAVHAIDRWRIDAGAVLMKDTGLAFSDALLMQFFEGTKIVDGETYTLSFLTDNHLYTTSATLSSKVEAHAWQINHWDNGVFVGGNYQGNGIFAVCIAPYGNPINLIAAKLELGETQTLAHQEESGNWVLNEILDYSEELAKCQRYQLELQYTNYRASLVSADILEFSVPTPVTLRSSPPVPSCEIRRIDGTVETGFTFSAYTVSSGIKVVAAKTGHGLTDGCLALLGGAIFDANL